MDTIYPMKPHSGVSLFSWHRYSCLHYWQHDQFWKYHQFRRFCQYVSSSPLRLWPGCIRCYFCWIQRYYQWRPAIQRNAITLCDEKPLQRTKALEVHPLHTSSVAAIDAAVAAATSITGIRVGNVVPLLNLTYMIDAAVDCINVLVDNFSGGYRLRRGGVIGDYVIDADDEVVITAAVDAIGDANDDDKSIEPPTVPERAPQPEGTENI